MVVCVRDLLVVFCVGLLPIFVIFFLCRFMGMSM